MRVGLVVYGDLGLVSGGNLYDQMLVEHLRGRGHEVAILSLPHGSYARHLLQNLVPRFWGTFDVLVSDELTHPSLALRALARPHVSIVHHLRSSEDHPPRLNDVYRKVEKRYLTMVDAFVFNSQATRESVEALLQKKAHNVVATPGGDRLAAGLSRDDVSERASEAGPLRLLFVGNVIPRKRLHVLVDALAELRDAGWRLDVVGGLDMDPGYVRDVRSRVERLGLTEKVTLVGSLDGDELAERYRNAQMLVVPSAYEGFGIVYLEAMAFGLPVIAGAAGATDEIVQHEATGFLVPPDDTFSLRMLLQRVLDDRELLARLSVTALERFADHPTWKQSMTSIENLLTRLV